MPFTQLLLCLAVGLVTGVVSALCGVGGGIIMVPAFVILLGLTQKQAVASSLVAIVLTSIAATARNSGNGFVNWQVSLATGAAAGIVAYFAAAYLKSLSNVTLTRVFGVLVVVMGLQMLISSYRTPKPADPANTQQLQTTSAANRQ